jgi:hypothetical protein
MSWSGSGEGTVVFVRLLLLLGNRVAPKKMKNAARRRLLVAPIARFRNASRKPNWHDTEMSTCKPCASRRDHQNDEREVVPRIPRPEAE